MRKLERATKEFHVMLVEIISVHSFEVRIYSKFSFLCAKILNYCLMNCEVGYRTSCPEIVTGNRRNFDGWYKSGLLFPNALCLTTTTKIDDLWLMSSIYKCSHKKGLLLPVDKLSFRKPHYFEAYITFCNEGISHSQLMHPMAPIQHVSESELKSRWYGSAMLRCEFLSTWTFNISEEK